MFVISKSIKTKNFSLRVIYVPKRMMMHAIRTAYVCLKNITANNLSPEDTSSFDTNVGLLALNHNLGTPQHKKAILGHMFNYRYNTKNMYNLSSHNTKIITNEPVGPSAHVITELPIA